MNSFMLDKATYYYYDLLKEKEQDLYRRFLYALLNMQVKVEINGVFSAEQIKKISRYIINDRPDIFWYRGTYVFYTRGNLIVSVEFKYVYAKSQKDKIIKDIESSSFYKMANSEIKAKTSSFAKFLRIYEFIIQNAEYDSAAAKASGSYYEYAYGLEGVVLKHRAVCSGYAKTFQYFANKHGLFCTVVTGKTKRERHAWNLVNINGDHYYVDATWGDPVFSNTSYKNPNYISYNYFCITTEELKASHQPIFDDPMPLCTASQYNYYKFMGMLDTRYSLESVVKHIVRTAKSGKRKVSIKYANKVSYQIAVDSLFRKSEVLQALKMATRYVSGLNFTKTQYTVDDVHNIISFSL